MHTYHGSANDTRTRITGPVKQRKVDLQVIRKYILISYNNKINGLGGHIFPHGIT